MGEVNIDMDSGVSSWPMDTAVSFKIPRISMSLCTMPLFDVMLDGFNIRLIV